MDRTLAGFADMAPAMAEFTMPFITTELGIIRQEQEFTPAMTNKFFGLATSDGQCPLRDAPGVGHAQFGPQAGPLHLPELPLRRRLHDVEGADGSTAWKGQLARNDSIDVMLAAYGITDADQRHAEIAALVGPGKILALGEQKGLLAQRNDDGSIRVYRVDRSQKLAGRQRDRCREPSAGAPAAAVAIRLLEPDDHRLAQYQRLELRALATLRLPRQAILDSAQRCHASRRRRAHDAAVYRAGGEYAMLDALELADALTEARHPTLGAALATYEQQLLARMVPAIEETMASQHLLMAADAPDGLAATTAAEREATSSQDVASPGLPN